MGMYSVIYRIGYEIHV